MIRLLLSKPGTGKSHWLNQQKADAMIDCTNKSHRAVLATICDQLGYSYPSRASIDDLLQLILAAPPTAIALDNIDRTSQKLCYSLLTLSTRHEIIATATEKNRIKPLLERQAAILVPPPPTKITEILAEHHPDLSPQEIRKIAALTDNPAAALNIAQSIRAGQPIPTPPSRDIKPLLFLFILSALYLLRWHNKSEVIAALLLVSGYLIRRMIWRST